MQNEMKNRLKSLINTFFASVDIDKFYLQNQKEKLVGWLSENGVIVPPCRAGETLHVVQIDYEGNYFMTTIIDVSKITLLSLLRAYEEKTVVYMSIDRKKAEKVLKEKKERNNND